MKFGTLLIMASVSAVLGLLLCACAAQRVPACSTVANHLLELATRENGGRPEAKLREGMVREFERQCRESPWSRERRACLQTAVEQEDTLRCPAN
jgi:hypothetical protein